MKKNYQIKTFGCAMNHSDSERISTFLEKNGFKMAQSHKKIELIVFNTCGVKQAPEDRVYSLINNIHKKDKQCKIILTGCLALRNDVQKRLQKKVNLFFPIHDFKIFENWINENYSKIENSLIKNRLLNQEDISYLSIKPTYKNNFEALIPIMTGCNNFCTYCVVPRARGREFSRPANDVLAEVKSLISNNYKHIILLGQNVNSYQSQDSIDFTKLLKKINSIPGKFWVSFVSSHPKDMSDNLIETITKSKKVLENIHLPVQAGDDEILRKMNRKYTREHYLKLIKKIKLAFKKNKPDLQYSITSDIIIGFPSETTTQFMKSADLMNKSKFDMVFFGQYSPRPGTIAWQMNDNISHKEKERREKYLNEILRKTALQNSKNFLNKKIEVLIEKEKDGFFFGKTRTLKNIKIITNKTNLIGKFVKVKVAKTNIWSLEGIL